MKLVAFGFLTAGFALATLVSGAGAGSTPTQIAFSVCPNVTQTITGGMGNYADLKGSFTVRGSYNTKTQRGTFVLKGIATY